jgi:glycine dehydrogenase subunit 2
MGNLNKKQADWQEKTIFEISKQMGGVQTSIIDENPEFTSRADTILNGLGKLKRTNKPELPELSELQVLRHYTRLSQMNYSIQTGFYPLGSCTMKYNPTVNDRVASFDGFVNTHPDQPENTVQGNLQLLYELEQWLGTLLGFSGVTLQPAAGAQGEYTGVLLIKAYHERMGQSNRNEILIPDSAHGTNPASAALAGFKIISIPSADDGTVEVEALQSAVGPNTAGLMLTNPNTLGIFEYNIEKMVAIVHEAGGLVYYDGANLNAIVGLVRPGDMGFDVAHINLHKTFSTPHGGGGPGSGVVAVNEKLEQFLPVPRIEKHGDLYRFNYDFPDSIGKVKSYFGNFGVLVRAYAYIYRLGFSGLQAVAKHAVLNANYMAHHIAKIKGFTIPYRGKHGLVKHEFVASPEQLKKETGVTTLDISKRLLDFMLHPPTIYFPLIVPEALMIEPTETESKTSCDEYIEALRQISREAYLNPEIVKQAPSNTTVGRIDDVKAARKPILSEKMKEK